MASVVNTIGLIGLEGYPIKVEVKVIPGPTKDGGQEPKWRKFEIRI